MRITLEHVEAFAAVVTAGSFSAAARRLGKSQSTISAAIAALEIDAGTDLFDRATRIPTLTEAGKALYPEAQAVIDRCIAFQGHADSLAAGDGADLSIAVNIPSRVLLPVLRDFEEAWPHVNLTVEDALSARAADLVRTGAACLGVAFAEPEYDRSIEFRQLGKLILLHVAAPTHPLAHQETVSFADMRATRRLVYSPQADVLPSAEYFQAALAWKVYGFQPLIEMTKAGLGWATIPRQLILDELAEGSIVEMQLEAYMHTDWLVGVDLTWSRTHAFTAPERWLRDRINAQTISERGREADRTAF